MEVKKIIPSGALEKDDIQGLLIRGYSNLHEAAFVLLNFSNPENTKAYLSSILPKITSGEKAPDDFALQFAITNLGLQAINIQKEIYESFCRQFKEGMTDEHRRFILGDYEDNDPANWIWGAPQHQPVHG